MSETVVIVDDNPAFRAQVRVLLSDPRTGVIQQRVCLTVDGSDGSDPEHGACTALALIGDPVAIALADPGRVLCSAQASPLTRPT